MGKEKIILSDHVRNVMFVNNYEELVNHEGEGNTADKSRQLKRFSHNRMERLGLVTGILIVICSLLIYQFSIVISQAIPQSEQILETYVQFVDRLRIISDQSIARAIAWLEIQAETIRGPKD